MEHLLLYIAKAYMPIFVVYKVNGWGMVMHHNPWVVFPNPKQMVQHAILSLVTKTTDSSVIVIISFDLCMSKSTHDTFVIVIYFINSLWVPCHVTVGFFWNYWYVWSCNGSASQGSLVIVQFIEQSNCLCERWGWQFVHLCISC
jgi:hypothetical protein